MNKKELLQKMIKEKEEELQRLNILRGYHQNLAEDEEGQQRESIVKKVDRNKKEINQVISYLEEQLDDIK